MFGRIGAARTSITFTSASIFGYVGSNRFFYSVAGNSVFGRFGSLRFFASVLSSGTILGRVGSSRTNCLAAGSWYFCRGTPAEAVIPVAALLLSG